MLWVIAGIVAVLGLASAVAWRHNPTKKKILRALDPSWRRRARVVRFSPEAEAREEENLYLSNAAMRDGCDIVWDKDRDDPPADLLRPLAHGTVVFVNTAHVPRFIAEVLPHIQGRFVLVSGNENNPTSAFDVDRLMAGDRCLHWFIENFELAPAWLTSGRVTPLPLGLDYHKLDPKAGARGLDMGLPSRPGNQQLTLKAVADEIGPIHDRPLKVYANFHLNMDTFLRHHHAEIRQRARAEARRALAGKAFMLWERRQSPRIEVWRRHEEALFEASPRGNGIDCHRTWEALFLRSIPIVPRSSIDPVFEGLPVALIDDWSEVTPERLAAWRDDFAPWFDRPLPEKLFSNHWIRRFHGFKTGA